MARHRRRSRRRIQPLLIFILLLLVGAVLLERVAVLPERLSAFIQSMEAELAPILREVGIELPEQQDEFGPRSSDTASDDTAVAAQALALLERIKVQPERPRGYERDDWPHWLDQDGDCMDARDEVLAAESLEPVRLALDGCNVASGLWQDAYTGETFRDPARLDVDHFVPLAEAHRSGGHPWSRERRAAFANDLEDSRSLIAVGASVNRSKSDRGPEEWLPPESAYHCRYAADWVAVKVRWSLSMDERERVTVDNLLRECTGQE